MTLPPDWSPSRYLADRIAAQKEPRAPDAPPPILSQSEQDYWHQVRTPGKSTIRSLDGAKMQQKDHTPVQGDDYIPGFAPGATSASTETTQAENAPGRPETRRRVIADVLGLENAADFEMVSTNLYFNPDTGETIELNPDGISGILVTTGDVV